MALEDIKNFVAVNGELLTAGQPSEPQIAEIARAGFQVVVNLGLTGQRYSLADERALVESLGMAYYHVPVDFQTPGLDDLHAFLDAMMAARGQKTFVHCAANFRVSSFIALYGQTQLGWSAAQADAHVRRVWEPNETWARFIDTARLALTERGDIPRPG